MAPSHAPDVSIVIVSWNSAEYLPRCLAALAEQTFRDFEVLVVDNASTDGSTIGLAVKHPGLQLRLERLSANLGFAAASNVGARLARGRWLALLNPDAFPDPEWMRQLVDTATSFPHAFFASRQLQALNPDLLDGEGDDYHVSGLAWRRNYGLPTYALNTPRQAFSACAAAAMYPRLEYLAAGGFDEDYFAYFEDVDLGFRLRLRGLTCIFVPTAVVYHVGTASTGKDSDFAVYHGHRNLVWTFLKDMPELLFWIYLPFAAALNAYLVLSYSSRGRGNTIWRAKLDAVRGLHAILRKRRVIQSDRLASTSSIHSAMRRGLFAHRRARRGPVDTS